MAQIQYFFSLGFFLLFLALELGLIWGLLLFKLKAIFTKNTFWQDTYRFWVRVFALVHFLSFAAFIVAIIQSIALWQNLIQRIGDVAGPLIAISFACMFIIKAGILGVMLFDARRLTNFIHSFTIFIVAIGVTIYSAVIIAIFSWMQAPHGTEVFIDSYITINTLDTILNPGLAYYLPLFAAFSLLLVAMLYLIITVSQAKYNSISSYFVHTLRSGFVIVFVGIVACTISISGLVSFAAQYQPSKAAATVGHWNSNSNPDLYLIAIPNETTQQNEFSSKINNAAKKWLYIDDDGNNVGLDQYSGMTPPVAATFWLFRLLVLGMAVFALMFIWAWAWYKKYQYNVHRMPKLPSRLLFAGAATAVLLLFVCLAYVFFGSLPYAVYASITFTEIFALDSSLQLILSNLLFIVCYVVLVLGFIAMLKHIVRHGVIPVTRRRII